VSVAVLGSVQVATAATSSKVVPRVWPRKRHGRLPSHPSQLPRPIRIDGFCCFCLWLLLLHATVQFPDVNCHRCLMLCTHAPWDTIPHASWLGCEPTHCVNGAVRGPDPSGRWACGANSLEIVFDSANAWFRAGSFPLRHASCCLFRSC